MLDLKTGRMAYVVLSLGRVHWMPDNILFAVPWEALSISFHDKRLILNISEETLKSAPRVSIKTNGLMWQTLVGYLRSFRSLRT